MPAIQPVQVDPFGNALRAYGGIQQMQTMGARNALLQDELQQRRQTQQALGGIDWEKPESIDTAIKQVMAINPKLGTELIELKHTGTKRQLEMMKTAGIIAEKFLPAMQNNPKAYKVFHEQYLTPMGLGSVMPKFETFITPDGQIDMDAYNQSVKFVGALGRLAKASAKELEPYTLSPGAARYQYDPATGKHEKVAETPFKSGAQTFTYDDEGNVELLGGPDQKFVKKPQKKDWGPKAHELATKDVQSNLRFSMNPDSKEAQEYYQKRLAFHKRAFGVKDKPSVDEPNLRQQYEDAKRTIESWPDSPDKRQRLADLDKRARQAGIIK